MVRVNPKLQSEVAAFASPLDQIVHHRIIRINIDLLESLLERKQVIFPVIRGLVYRNMNTSVLVRSCVDVQQDGLERSFDENIPAGEQMTIESLVVSLGHINGLHPVHRDLRVHPEILQFLERQPS